MSADHSDQPSWGIDYTPEVRRWLRTLSEKDATRIAASIRQLERDGPTLGRGCVDSIKGSRHHNMKELRSVGRHLRILFAFDPRRRAILLIGGDKAGNWRGWYARHIPIADKLLDNHLRSLGKEGHWKATPARAGDRSSSSR